MKTISPEVKTALVTGTDHGVGFSLAKKLLSRGYFVIAVRVDETEKQIDTLQSSYPDQMAIVCADIGNDESVLKASNDIKNMTDHIDLLINCAGILGDMSKNLGDDLDFDEIMRVINVNAIGTLRITNALSSLVLNSTEKTIVNISSEAGSIADCWRTGWFGYCMSKAANNMQSALELGNRTVMMDRGRIVMDVSGEKRSSLTVQDLLDGFREVSGKSLSNDRMLLI